MNQTFDIHLLKNAVYESASTIKELREEVKVFSKKHEVDLVTEADLRSEEILINAIKKEYPNDGIISEESDTVNPKADRFWVIDPLDGTVNYANNIPQVAITLMLIEDSSPTQAYVFDIYNEILYKGYKGSGAFKNSEKLEVSKSTSMQKAIVATGQLPRHARRSCPGRPAGDRSRCSSVRFARRGREPDPRRRGSTSGRKAQHGWPL